MSDRSADENGEHEGASDRAESPVDHELPIHNVRENWAKFPCIESHHVRRFSLDGRYVYRLRLELSELQIIDLLRGSQLSLKSKTSFDDDIEEFVLVNTTSIVALGADGLWLLRMHVRSGEFEAIQLADHMGSRPSYVLAQIVGENADVKHAVIQWRWENTELHFCRLRLDDARLDVDWTEAMDGGKSFFQLSRDGRSLFGIRATEYEALRVYNLEEKTWTTKEMSGYSFPTVDSLERLAMDAFRKHNMNVKGDFNFHFFLNETTPGKKILPSLYPNMKPLP
ncbi:hypothetical protein M3Y99_01376400 [Aphelenchoides fujianensis]|nr:hypothetical protein M3Y99_01376400 [Aphelenchoides fujianensis]